MKLPAWMYGRRTLIFIIGFVTLLILLMGIFERKLFSAWKARRRAKSIDSSKIARLCKKFTNKESINWNYFYYHEDIATKRSIVWCKVPKAGSTTLTKMFLRIAGAKDINNSTRIHKLLRQYYPRLPAKIMKHRLRNSKTFMVVRDPFERILSAYRDKLESYERDLEYRDGYYYDHYGRFMILGNSTSERKEPTWDEFIKYLLKTSVARYDEHWMPMTRLCSPCNVDFNMIIKMEHFDADIKKPLRYARINESNLGWSHKTGTSNRKIINSYFRNLTLEDVKKLYVKYKRDFQLFGYTPYRYFRLFGNSSATNSNSTTINL